MRDAHESALASCASPAVARRTCRLLLTIAVATALVASACATAATPAASTVAAPAQNGLGEQQSAAGSVTVAVSWIDAPAPTARVVMDTHSVDLDSFDLARSARLRLDGGSWVAASAWNAPSGGHHRQGTLVFATLEPGAFAAARTIELEITDVAAFSRLLRWERSA